MWGSATILQARRAGFHVVGVDTFEYPPKDLFDRRFQHAWMKRNGFADDG